MAIKTAPRARSDAVPLRTFRSSGRPVAIAGLGVYAPEKVLSNQDLERMVETSDQWIRERTGIKRRHIAEPGTTTFSLASAAAREAPAVGSAVLPALVHWTTRGTCVLFADGAAAAFLRPAEHGGGFRAWCLGSDGRGYEQISCGDIPRGAYAAGQSDPTIGMRGPDVFK